MILTCYNKSYQSRGFNVDDFKLKVVLSILGAIVFSFIFIILALALPLDIKETIIAKPQNKLEEVSQSLK